MPALQSLDAWPVTTFAAAVVGPDGVLESHGDVHRPCALASVTKPMTAVAVVQLAERGAVALVHHPTALETGFPEADRERLRETERELFGRVARLVAGDGDELSGLGGFEGLDEICVCH